MEQIKIFGGIEFCYSWEYVIKSILLISPERGNFFVSQMEQKGQARRRLHNAERLCIA